MSRVLILLAWWFLLIRTVDVHYAEVVGPVGTEAQCQAVQAQTREALGRRASWYLLTPCWSDTTP